MALVVCNSNKENREKNVGFLEMCINVGLLVGPVFGSTMSALGGYSFPFCTLATIHCILLPVVCVSMVRFENDAAVADDEPELGESAKEFLK